MTICFMSLFALILHERCGSVLYKIPGMNLLSLMSILLSLGVFSILHWQRTNDLRVYALVQFFPLLSYPEILLMFPKSSYSQTEFITFCFMGYAVSKVSEVLDRPIFNLTRKVISGHTIKHLTAGLSILFLVQMLGEREIVQRY